MTLIWNCLAVSCLVMLCMISGSESSPNALSKTAADAMEAQGFPDFGFLPPVEQYTGSLFRLRQDYPGAKPEPDKKAVFLDIAFNENGAGKENWKKYLLAVRDYCFEGNVDQTLPTANGRVDENWILQNNRKRNWYHVPWQHWDHSGRAGREGIRGLTREATVQPG